MTDRSRAHGQVDSCDTREQRKFGYVMAGAIIILGLVRYGIRWLLHGPRPPAPVYFLLVATALVLVALAWPRALKPLLIVWMRIALAMNWVVNHVLMSLAFFGLIVPMRVIMAVIRKDPLNRKWDPRVVSYCEPPEEQPDEFARYKNQF